MIGATLGHFHIEEKIGEGGMGEVFRARDEHLDRDVAIKTLKSGSFPDEHSRRRFYKEAMALSKLNHHNIATIYDFDTQDNVDFLVMEYIPGQTLAEAAVEGNMPIEQAIDFGVQLAQGLEAAHRRGIIHRDLKPGNIRITPEGELKILDFGLAKFFRQQESHATGDSLTLAHGVAGTPAYMSPEQLCGESPGPTGDLFSVGIVLYELLTGRNPFYDVYSQSISYNILHSEPPPPSTIRGGIPPALEKIIMRLLTKRPEDRLQSAGELKKALGGLSAVSHGGRPALAGSRLARRLMTGAATAAVILLIALYLNMPIQTFSAAHQDRTIRRLTFSGLAGIPVWSPDGDNIAYCELGERIMLISPSGGTPRKLYTGALSNIIPWSWAHDGSAVIAHGRDPQKSYRYAVVRLGIYGEEPQILAESSVFGDMSSDGRKLLYNLLLPGPESGIYMMDLETSEKSKIAESKGAGTSAYKAFFSPDDSKIAYTRWNGLGHEIWIINSDGTEDHRIETDPIQLGGHYSWAKDGQGIIIAGQLHGLWSIWRINISGTGHTRLTPGSEAERHVSLAPDGIRFAFGRHQDLSRIALIETQDGSLRYPNGPDVAIKHPVFAGDANSIFFQALVNGKWEIWKAATAAKTPAQPVISLDGISCLNPAGADNDNIIYIRSRVARERRWGKIEWSQTAWCSSCDGGRHGAIEEIGDRIERFAPTPYRSGRLLYSTNLGEDLERIHYRDTDGTIHLLHEDTGANHIGSFDWGPMDDEIVVARNDTSLQIRGIKVVSTMSIRTRELSNIFVIDSLTVDDAGRNRGYIASLALSPDRQLLAVVVRHQDADNTADILLYNVESSRAKILREFRDEEIPYDIAWSGDGRTVAVSLARTKQDIFISEPSEQWAVAMK